MRIIRVPEIVNVYKTKMTIAGKEEDVMVVPLHWKCSNNKKAAPACGCTDSLAVNYDPTAIEECDPSTCEYLAKEVPGE